MAHDGCNWYFLFWAIFCHFTPLAAGKMKMSKKIKKHLKISSFYTSVPKIMIRWCTVRFLRYGGQQADGWKKWHIEVGALPKNLKYNIEISICDLLQKLHNINFTWHRSQGFLREGVEKQEFSAFPINFFENKQKLFSSNLIVYTPY